MPFETAMLFLKGGIPIRRDGMPPDTWLEIAEFGPETAIKIFYPFRKSQLWYMRSEDILANDWRLAVEKANG